MKKKIIVGPNQCSYRNNAVYNRYKTLHVPETVKET